MWSYWLIFMIPVFAAIHNSRIVTNPDSNKPFFDLNRAWLSLLLVLSLLIGYRYEVGGDWHNYMRSFDRIDHQSLGETLSMGDPGYMMLQWASAQLGWGIFGTNLMGALLFTLGLTVFCRSLPRPWLALVVAVPYLVIVVAMGYTRQSIAIGLAMLGLEALSRRSVRSFVFWVVIAATFHKSAALLLPIAVLAVTKRRVWTAVWIAIVTFGVYLSMLEKSVGTLYKNYVEAEYQSQGALVRLLMNALPATILIIWRKRFQMSLSQMKLWQWMAVISLGLLALFYVSPASTAIDRVALLMLPLQLVVFSYVPEVFGGLKSRNREYTLAVLIYYGLVQFVWLNYASHAYAWLPYRFYLLETAH